MATSHLMPGIPAAVTAFGDQIADHKTTALLKSNQLEVIRLVLQAGRSLPAHAVDGDITIQCIEGQLEISLANHAVVLEAGQLIFLPGKQRHGVFALKASSALVTIGLES